MPKKYTQQKADRSNNMSRAQYAKDKEEIYNRSWIGLTICQRQRNIYKRRRID